MDHGGSTVMGHGSIKMSLDSMMGGNFFSYSGALVSINTVSLHTTVEYSCTPKVGNVAHETLGLESNEFRKLGCRAS